MPAPQILSREACRRVDELAVSRYGLATLVLMENAARGLADAALRLSARSPLTPRRAILLACGPGNNGGDGYAAARHLANAGRRVRVVALAPPATPDAIANHATAAAMGIPIDRLDQDPRALPRALGHAPGLIVECLFGTGLTRTLAGPAAAAVEAIHAARARGWRVLAADLPAGLDADTGRPVGGGPCIRAHATATFAAMKPGLARGPREAGRIAVVDIGVPAALIRALAAGR
jgi:NAD(P)H-hydrate epimerase